MAGFPSTVDFNLMELHTEATAQSLEFFEDIGCTARPAMTGSEVGKRRRGSRMKQVRNDGDVELNTEKRTGKWGGKGTIRLGRLPTRGWATVSTATISRWTSRPWSAVAAPHGTTTRRRVTPGRWTARRRSTTGRRVPPRTTPRRGSSISAGGTSAIAAVTTGWASAVSWRASSVSGGAAAVTAGRAPAITAGGTSSTVAVWWGARPRSPSPVASATTATTGARATFSNVASVTAFVTHCLRVSLRVGAISGVNTVYEG